MGRFWLKKDLSIDKIDKAFGPIHLAGHSLLSLLPTTGVERIEPRETIVKKVVNIFDLFSAFNRKGECGTKHHSAHRL